MQFSHEHEEIRRTLRRVIDNEINPYVDEWEKKLAISHIRLLYRLRAPI